jgi:hypothetical protein
MRKLADIETWEAVGAAAGWIKSAGGCAGAAPDPRKEQLQREFIERMKMYGMTEGEIEKALKSGHLERLMRILRKP